eukprot:1183903-Prorocentrum_minimum.AAC.1
MPGGGANRITAARALGPASEHNRRGSQSHHRGGNMPGGVANHITAARALGPASEHNKGQAGQ